MKSSLLVAAMLAATPVGGGLPAEADAVLARLAEAEVLRGSYQQTRHLPQLSRPLRSSGRFLLVAERGLHWDQEEPFSSALTIQEHRLVQRIAEDEPSVIRPAERPVVFEISRIMLGLLSGDGHSIEENFEVGYESDGDDWSMTLTPREDTLAAVMERIAISGRAHVEVLEMETTDGGRTRIVFTDLDADCEPLSEAENALFAD